MSDSRCHIPECDLEQPEFTPDWLLNVVPGTSLASFDNCQRFSNTSAATIGEGVCPAAWFNRDQLQRCERWLYQNTDTVVYDVSFYKQLNNKRYVPDNTLIVMAS